MTLDPMMLVGWVVSLLQTIWFLWFKSTNDKNLKLVSDDKAADKARLVVLEAKADSNALTIATHRVYIEGLSKTHEAMRLDLDTKFTRIEGKIDQLVLGFARKEIPS
jgi:hypothetical protein